MQHLDPKAVWLFFFNFILRFLIIAIFFGVWVSAISFSPISFILAVIVYIVLCYLWAKLTYSFYKYELTEAGFRKELGVIYKKYVTIPYDRIQNVDIYRGILARLLGLSDLNIQTAGASMSMGNYGMMGGGSEGRLPGLSKEIAEKLRDELIDRARKSKNQGL